LGFFEKFWAKNMTLLIRISKSLLLRVFVMGKNSFDCGGRGLEVLMNGRNMSAG
jgi:hypothetical protein